MFHPLHPSFAKDRGRANLNRILDSGLVSLQDDLGLSVHLDPPASLLKKKLCDLGLGLLIVFLGEHRAFSERETGAESLQVWRECGLVADRQRHLRDLHRFSFVDRDTRRDQMVGFMHVEIVRDLGFVVPPGLIKARQALHIGREGD